MLLTTLLSYFSRSCTEGVNYAEPTQQLLGDEVEVEDKQEGEGEADEETDDEEGGEEETDKDESDEERSEDDEEHGEGEGDEDEDGKTGWEIRNIGQGDIVVVCSVDGGYFVAEVVDLLDVVWDVTCKAEGDMKVHEYGGDKGNGLWKSKHFPMYDEVKGNRRRVAWNKATKPQDNLMGPVTNIIWAESVTNWGGRDRMLTPNGRLKDDVVVDCQWAIKENGRAR